MNETKKTATVTGPRNTTEIVEIDETTFKICTKLLERTSDRSMLSDAALFHLLLGIREEFLLKLIKANNDDYSSIIIPLPLYDDTYGVYNYSLFKTVRLFMSVFGYKLSSSKEDEDNIYRYDIFENRICYKFEKMYHVNNAATIDIAISALMRNYYSDYIYSCIYSKIIVAENNKSESTDFVIDLAIPYINKICTESYPDIDTISDKGITSIISGLIKPLRKESGYLSTYDYKNGKLSVTIMSESYIEKQSKQAESEKINKELDMIYNTDTYLLEMRCDILRGLIDASEELSHKTTKYVLNGVSDEIKRSDLVIDKVFTRVVSKQQRFPKQYLFDIFIRLNKDGELSKICDAYEVEMHAVPDDTVSDSLSVLRVKIWSAKRYMKLKEDKDSNEDKNNGKN